MSVWLSAYLSLSTHPPVCLPACLSVCLTIYLSIKLSTVLKYIVVDFMLAIHSGPPYDVALMQLFTNVHSGVSE